MKKRPTYLRAVKDALATVFKGLRLSGKHYFKGYDRAKPLGIADPDYFQKTQGPITIQYPMEKVPVPDNGRYRLFMETDDCIGCDKCARICPVDCITIETFRADGDLGRTSDGTMKRLHLPTFDIDMAKCMYCGLCTTVCPTECLTMTPVYDYSEYDRDNFLYHFGAYSPNQEREIRQTTELALAAKKASKESATPENKNSENTPRPRPLARPVSKPAEPATAETKPETEESAQSQDTPRPRPRPMMKRREDGEATEQPASPAIETPAVDSPAPETPAAQKEPSDPPKVRPRPIMKPKTEADAPAQDAPVPPSPEIEPPATETPPKPRPRPIMRKPEDQKGGPAS